MMYEKKIRVSKAVKDVERSGNIAPSRLRSAKGSPDSPRSFHIHGTDKPDRGPAVGFKKRRRTGSSTDHARNADLSPVVPNIPGPLAGVDRSANIPEVQVASSSRLASPDSARQRSRSGSRIPASRDVPLLGLPRPMIDELLAVYFTHVHVRSDFLTLYRTSCGAEQVECMAFDLQTSFYAIQRLSTIAALHACHLSLRLPTFIS